MTRRRAVIAGILLAVPLLVLTLVWALQRSLIYFPDRSEVPSASQMLPDGQDLTLTTNDGLDLTAWFAPPSAESADRNMAVLMAPGNGGNREGRAGLARALQDRGFSVLVLDYRGYGGNPGRPDEDGLVQDGLAASDALEEQGFPPERTIYLGESLGGGVVAALMEQRPPAAVVFRSPFTSLADVGSHHYPWLPVRTFLHDQFPVAAYVSASEVPVTVIRAREDSVVPSELSAEVAAASPNLFEELIINDTDHNSPIMFGFQVAEAVVRISDSLTIR